MLQSLNKFGMDNQEVDGKIVLVLWEVYIPYMYVYIYAHIYLT